MAYIRGQFPTASDTGPQTETPVPNHNSRNVVYLPGSLGIGRSENLSPWASGQRFSQTNDWYREHIHSSERLFLSANHRNSANSHDDFQRSNINMPPPLPQWVWTILVNTLGIGPKTSRKRYSIATALHILTLTSAFMFGASGLFFNAFDTLSEFTKTSLLVCVAKSILGLYWIGLGIYANILAARLFSNKRMVDCIRLHSKTFLKVSTAFIIMLLSATVVFVNLYSNKYLLEDQKPASGSVVSNDANCVTAGVDVVLCKIYFGSKIVYSCFCLMWNLLVVGIFMSVCRTHTISIRRFMKELLYDTKIYVEFFKIQALEKQVEYIQSLSTEAKQNQQPLSDFHNISDTNIWDDDILGFDQDISSASDPPSNAELLQTLKMMRMTTSDQLANDMASSFHGQDNTFDGRNRRNTPYTSWIDEAEESESVETASASSHHSIDATKHHTLKDISDTQEQPPVSLHSDEITSQQTVDQNPSTDTLEHPTNKTDPERKSAPDSKEENEVRFQTSKVKTSLTNTSQPTVLVDLSPPIMSNEELLFTYFQLLRRFSSTSRLLQRWISNWITFIMLWCALLIVYWSNHTAQLTGISQFLIPLVTLGLLTSGYAEVNFEGERLMKCVLPTEERMPIFYYFQNSKLELKIFSFTMTYNTIVTVVAGIAVTFATRIILDQFSVGKGHPF